MALRLKRDPRSDEALVGTCNEGNPRAFEALYLRHKDFVLRVALRFAPDFDTALDVLQDTFVQLLRRFPPTGDGITLTAKLTTLLYPIAKNTAISAAGRCVDFLPSQTQQPTREIPMKRLIHSALRATAFLIGATLIASCATGTHYELAPVPSPESPGQTPPAPSAAGTGSSEVGGVVVPGNSIDDRPDSGLEPVVPDPGSLAEEVWIIARSSAVQESAALEEIVVTANKREGSSGRSVP